MPRDGDFVGVWGQSPYAARGEAVAARCNVPLVRIEDAFLRSLHPGRLGEPPLGLLVDHRGVHFDGRHPSDLEHLLKTHPLDDTALLERARGGIARMQDTHLTKYSATLPDAEVPAPGYVLVIDQTRNDASVRASGGDRARFLEMLCVAREENPGARILLKLHPETQAGLRAGHFRNDDAQGPIEIYDGTASPWVLLEGAIRVYTLSSQMGFEAILAGHRPRVFGLPFYAGWGLTEDEVVLPRRGRNLTRAQLCAGAMILYPKWYDPYRSQAATFEDVLNVLDAKTRAWREDHIGWVASGARLWKRPLLQKFFGKYKSVQFEDDVDKARDLVAKSGRNHMVWASFQPNQATNLEDGFLRSRGLGATLVPPLSLVLDPVGIHFDHTAPSRLEQLIAQRANFMRPDQIERAHRLMTGLVSSGLSKYNLSGDMPILPTGHLILVPGQVEDDASILRGSPNMQSNTDLLRATRDANPEAIILWKPHPDVEAGLRKGAVEAPERFADLVLNNVGIAQVLDAVDEIWTMTSGTGFEALMRGRKVTTFGAPFYAGWGLTRDFGPVPDRRRIGPRPNLEALVHATLIDYPRYFDPISQEACPVEVVVDRLKTGSIPRPGLMNRTLSKLQGALASHAHLWRG